MSREFRFVQVDVFTERVFGGNPLAVVFEAASLSDVEMQAIAREMNCSETTFLLPPTRPDCAARVRIFTPAREVRFAGHPTIGTSWVLATEKLLPRDSRRFNLEEGIGPVEVTLEGEPTRPSFLWMRHGEARFGPERIERAGFARALGLAESDLLAGFPVQTGSTGSAFLYVPLRAREVVDRARLDVPALLAAQGEGSNLGVFVFAVVGRGAAEGEPSEYERRLERGGAEGEPSEHESRARGDAPARVYARMFAPHTSGIPEDPATGSASGPLGAYLVQHGLVTPADTVDIVSEQGTRMGRPSFIRIRVGMTAGRISEILVGGSVVPVIEGRLRVP
ncbi:MAG: PhzF family phenazine biosynthesis protein [Candidatus Rokuibacteriota bacterium]